MFNLLSFFVTTLINEMNTRNVQKRPFIPDLDIEKVYEEMLLYYRNKESKESTRLTRSSSLTSNHCYAHNSRTSHIEVVTPRRAMSTSLLHLEMSTITPIVESPHTKLDTTESPRIKKIYHS